MTPAVHVALPLPALSTLTGRNLTPGYCPACLDAWYRQSRADAPRTDRMHPQCRGLLEQIHAAPPAGLEECAA